MPASDTPLAHGEKVAELKREQRRDRALFYLKSVRRWELLNTLLLITILVLVVVRT